MSMAQRLFIVTGSSRGMGAAMAEQLAAPEHRLLCIARRANPALDSEVEQWQVDLSDPLPVAGRLQRWLEALDGSAFASAALINNAGVLTRIGPVDADSDEVLSKSLRVGLEAPLLLSAAFLRATRKWTADKRVLNISSGLGRRAMAGQAPYCGSKAGMDHMSRSMAMDEALREQGARIVSLAPGVIDTEMQVHLRAGEASGFPDKSRFVGLKAEGQLSSAHEAAAKVLAYLNRADFGSNPVADVRDA